MNRSTMHRALSCFLLAGLLAPAIAFAAKPAASGLGQAWPNAPDLSASPRWHVYAFERDGIRYVQINDSRGVVRGAFATANGVFLVLPMGHGSQVDIGDGSQPPTQGETIYSDGDVQVTATPQTDGTHFRALPICKDPVECSTHFANP